MSARNGGNVPEQLYGEISKTIEQYRSIAYRAVNSAMVKAYWEIGRLIVEQEQKGMGRAEYGKRLIKSLSARLAPRYGKGFDGSNLWNMRLFYQCFQKFDALRRELTWTHYRLIIKVQTEKIRDFYVKESIAGNWSTRQLERQINTAYYERMLLTNKGNRQSLRKAIENDPVAPKQFIKDPYILEFLQLSVNHKLYEKDLEQGLIDKLQEFLMELGKGFSFVGRQYRITAEDEHFYIDLVFYNYLLKCFLLVDLKAGKLAHQDIGQMDFYVRYFEDQVRQGNDNPTIGLILCAEKNQALAKYSLLNDSKQIFASKYKLYLPTEEELQRELQKERELLEIEKGLN
jgi:predicted nuclease of restriction endonuclease-like (RecB) superfamily